MAQLGTTFEANSVDPSSGFPVVPAGKYLAQIVHSEMKDTKDRTGKYLQFEIEIIDGPEKGHKIFDRLNLYNSNDTAVQIAQRTLSAVCHATGVMSVSDSEQLHARRMIIEVRIEPGKGQYRDQNRVVGYFPPDGSGSAPAAAFVTTAGATQTQPVQQAARSAPPTTGSAPPWRNRASA